MVGAVCNRTEPFILGELLIMRTILKTEYIPTEEDRENDDYEPLLTLEEQSEPVVFELTAPVDHSGEKINELTVNPPKVKNALSRNNRGKNNQSSNDDPQTQQFFAKICNVPVATIEELLLKDLNRLGNLVMAFTEQTPKVQD